METAPLKLSHHSIRPKQRFRELSDAERAKSLSETLALRSGEEPLWVFGYGSLMWKPCFDYDHVEDARLEGHARSFCIWTVIARGSLENPGLGLGLRRGEGRVGGKLFRLSEATLGEGLHALWDREMLTGIYRPHWLKFEGEGGERRAITFVVDESHPQFAGELELRRQAEIIAAAVGKFGRCRDYLAETLQALDRSGLRDDGMGELLRQVDLIVAGEY